MKHLLPQTHTHTLFKLLCDDLNISTSNIIFRAFINLSHFGERKQPKPNSLCENSFFSTAERHSMLYRAYVEAKEKIS